MGAHSDTSRTRPRLLSLVLCLAVVAGCSSSGASGERPPGSGIAEVRLEDLTADQHDKWPGDGRSWAVTLTWAAPDVSVDHYVVTRDGSVIDNDVDGAEYRDRAIWPSQRYRYEVVAVDAASRSSLPATVSIRTNTPSLADARLVGDFDVRMTPTAWETPERPQPYEARFSFKPRCREGVCSVDWDEYYGTATGVLTRDGATYRGTAHGTFSLVDCQGEKVDERIEISLEVVRANGSDARDRFWLADGIRGTLRQIGPPVPGCQEVSLTWRFAGS